MIKLLVDYGADLDAANPKNWTPLSYCKAKGKYGATEEKGIYPEVGGLGERGSRGQCARHVQTKQQKSAVWNCTPSNAGRQIVWHAVCCGGWMHVPEGDGKERAPSLAREGNPRM